MEIVNKHNSTFINKSLICVVNKEIFEWWEGATFPKEYFLNIKFRGCPDWVKISFETKEDLLEIYEQLKLELV